MTADLAKLAERVEGLTAGEIRCLRIIGGALHITEHVDHPLREPRALIERGLVWRELDPSGKHYRLRATEKGRAALKALGESRD